LNAFIVLYIFGYIYGFFIKQSIKNKYGNRGRDKEHDCTESDPDQTILLSTRQRRKKRQLYSRCKSYSDSEYKIFTTKVNSETERSLPTISFLSDGIPFVVDNCANTYVCCVRSLFIGDLVPSGAGLKTANGDREEVLQGTIRVSWEDNYGMTHTYELDETKYTLHGDINVIAVCKLGDKFGADDDMFDSDENGTSIKTNANYSIFTSSLPELYVNTSNSTFQSYCTKLKHL
jgi:hypothetical protein